MIMNRIQKNNRLLNIASIVLAGGKGTRLFPLTLHHSKPAIAYGGRYRLIDIPISNSLNSNIRQIFVIGQYLSAELGHHLAQTYQFDHFFPGMLDFLTPEEYPSGQKTWFEGTADAIRKNLDKITKLPVDYYLILSGDQLYNINFQKMFEFAIDKEADLTIATLPIAEKEAKRMGLLCTDDHSIVTDFYEKPQEEQILQKFCLPPSFFSRMHLPHAEKKYLGSMGIYIFKKEALLSLLQEQGEDFGKHLIPKQLTKGKTAAFVYDGYWEDIGTISSFYEANLALVDGKNIGLQMQDEKNPIYSRVNYLPGSLIKGTIVNRSILCEGSIIEAEEIQESVIGLRTKIGTGTKIYRSIILGNTHYLPGDNEEESHGKFRIGQNCLLKNVIIDEHVHIGNNVRITNKNNLSSHDGEHGIFVRDGITIVTSGSSIPDGYVF
ncbi:MAG: glucose-1-phosphate adenylyltransferase [Parachlamydiales bacterium]|nr:glucose-1-phosphate adenylyltransferase [Parachlamydiales bacterium]